MAKTTKKKANSSIKTQPVAYRFRAEGIADIFSVLSKLKIERCLRIEITPLQSDKKNEHLLKGMPDRECTLLVEGVTKKQILQAMKKVADGHVMAETLRLLNAYDGERKSKRSDG